MYLSHYHLKVKPFQITPDPHFLWLGDSHKRALSIFKDGIAENKGLILLVGDVGTGKTTLINKLIESLDKNTLVASVQYPGFDILDFYNFLADSFKMGKTFSNKGDFLIQFIHFLHEKYEQNKKVLLIIDEAQGLSDEILDELRLLSNLERTKVKLLNIFLVGQDEMDNILAEPHNKMLAQSISAKYSLGPLKKWEVKNYINFRLQVAGADYRIFSKGAIQEIVACSQCYPRLINVICDHALLTGYVRGKNKIDAAIIKECAKEHELHLIDHITSKQSDNHSDTHADSTRSGVNYHWALPMILVLALFLLILAGYFSYLKTDSEASKPSVTEQIRETAAPIVVKNDLEKKKIAEEIRFSLDKYVLPSDKQESSITEEDLKQNQGAQEKKIEPVRLTVSDRGEKANPKSPTPVEEVEKKPADLSSDKAPIQSEATPVQLVLNVPPNMEKLPEEACAPLDQFLATVVKYPNASILIEGHTDSSGDKRQNERLSQLRAEAVKKYFIDKGIDPAKITAIGMEDKDPIASNETLAGRDANRRIEISLIPEPTPGTSQAQGSPVNKTL